MRHDEMPLLNCREAFETWMTGDDNYPHLIHKSFGGSYLHEETSMKWDGWKTAWNTRPATLTPEQVETVRIALTDACDWIENRLAVEGHPMPSRMSLLVGYREALALLPQGEKK